MYYMSTLSKWYVNKQIFHKIWILRQVSQKVISLAILYLLVEVEPGRFPNCGKPLPNSQVKKTKLPDKFPIKTISSIQNNGSLHS